MNAEEFPRSFFRGIFEGFWWSFVSMTTVGYVLTTLLSCELNLFVLNKAFAKGIFNFSHGTIIRTGITSRKIPCYMRDSTCRSFIVKKAKIF